MDVPQHAQPIIDLIRKVWKNVKESRVSYLDENKLKGLKITLTTLDFDSGKPGDNGEIFIRPFPYSKMLQLINRNRPWLNPYGCPSILPVDEALDNDAQARNFFNVAQGYLSLNSDVSASGVIDETVWEIQVPSKQDCLSRWDDYARWNVPNYLVNNDSSKPHVIAFAFVADQALLRDGLLSLSEVQMTLLLTGRRLLRKECRHKQIVPVTMICVSGYQARITQIYIDAAEEHKIKSIVEVKAEMRYDNLPLFGIQETGEMAAWISHDPPEDFDSENRLGT
ncbi:hypothetical protein F4818DRAFT_8079 [Hypoxylon cercidicola]|nr:hypothetical protein F4818DRAFT_8079 [Hypoxylon cercidicola]